MLIRWHLSYILLLLILTITSVQAEICPSKATKCIFSPSNATRIQSISFTDRNAITVDDLTAVQFSQFTQLTELIIQNQLTLVELPVGIFDGLEELSQLTISSSGLKSLPTNVFNKNTRLVTLSLSSNSLTSLPSGIFDSLSRLQNLYLDNNRISSLPSGLFDTTNAIIFLGLSYNQLTESSLSAQLLNKMQTLQILDLHHNKIASLPNYLLDMNTNIIRISLSNNLLTTWNYGIFDALTKLDFLNLASNQLPSPPPAFFDKLITLTSLSLSGNQMTALPAKAFAKLAALRSLDLFSNLLATFDPQVLPSEGVLTRLLLHDNLFTTVPANSFSTLFRLVDNEFSIDRMGPGAPMNLRVTTKTNAVAGSVVLTWEPANVWALPTPQTKRGEPITGQTIFYSTDLFETQQELKIVAGLTTITIPNVDTTVQILFRVAASNAAGLGAFSNVASNFALDNVNTNLLDLSVADAPLFPTFNAAFTKYTATVKSTRTSTTVRAIVAAGTSVPNYVITSERGTRFGTYKNGIDAPVDLIYGKTTIGFKVTAQDGLSSQTYTIDIVRPLPNLDLASLSMTGVTITPAFAPSVTSYQGVVGFTTSTISYVATVAEITSLLYSNGINNTNNIITSGTSTTVALDVGQNIIKITVSSPDMVLNKTYTITIGRAIDGMSPIADINTLSLTKWDGDILPQINTQVYNYMSYVYSSVDTTSIIATSVDSTATMTVTYGNTTDAVYISGSSLPISLSYGNQSILFTITAQDRVTIKTYTLTIIRSTINVDLESLIVSGWQMLPIYTKRVREYLSAVSYVTENALVIGSASDVTSVVQARINNGEWSNPITANEIGPASAAVQIPLLPGVNVIDILVTGSDRITTKMYTVKITRGQSISFGAAYGISPSQLSWITPLVFLFSLCFQLL